MAIDEMVVLDYENEVDRSDIEDGNMVIGLGKPEHCQIARSICYEQDAVVINSLTPEAQESVSLLSLGQPEYKIELRHIASKIHDNFFIGPDDPELKPDLGYVGGAVWAKQIITIDEGLKDLSSTPFEALYKTCIKPATVPYNRKSIDEYRLSLGHTEYPNYSDFLYYLSLIYPSRTNCTRVIELEGPIRPSMYSLEHRVIHDYLSRAVNMYASHASVIVLRQEIWDGPLDTTLLESCKVNRVVRIFDCHKDKHKLIAIDTLIKGKPEFYLKKRAKCCIYELIYDPHKCPGLHKLSGARRQKTLRAIPNKLSNSFLMRLARETFYKKIKGPDKLSKLSLVKLGGDGEHYAKYGSCNNPSVVGYMQYIHEVLTILKSDTIYAPILRRIRSTESYKADIALIIHNWRIIKDTKYGRKAEDESQIKTNFLIAIAREARDIHISKQDYIDWKLAQELKKNKD